jgi:hypothetical protein
MEGLRGLRPALQGSLAAASRWFHCMTIPAPINRLHYSFEPSANKHVDRHCPIRDIGTAADLAVLQRYLGSREYDAVRLRQQSSVAGTVRWADTNISWLAG